MVVTGRMARLAPHTLCPYDFNPIPAYCGKVCNKVGGKSMGFLTRKPRRKANEV